MMDFMPLTVLVLFATGLIMILTGSVIRDSEGDIIQISGSVYLGITLLTISILAAIDLFI